jgi:hypothetical protein
MIAFKQLLASDVIVTPFEVNKSFTFSGSGMIAPTVGIDRFLGVNKNSNPWVSGSNVTGYIPSSLQDQELVYDSIKQLYYSNYLSSSYGDNINTASIIPGVNTGSDVLVGTTPSPGMYDTYNQTTLTFAKSFPTGSNELVGVISIPSRLFGDYIQPNSFHLRYYDMFQNATFSFTDDGEGNLKTGSTIVGNVFYPHGMIIITNQIYSYGIYNTTTNITCSFSSSYMIYETQYKCTFRENEFNYTLNPTLQYDTSGSVYSYTTSSQWAPYVSTVGLYDEAQNLLAVGKLSQPLPTSATTDTTILINLDM